MRARIGVLAPFLAVLAVLGVVACTTFTLGPAPVPTIESLSPGSVIAGSPAFDLTINGSGFVNRFSKVRFGSIDYGPYQVSVVGNAIVIRIAAASVATARQLQVAVHNPTTFGGGGTASADFTINNPVPNVTGVSTNLPPPNDQNAVPARGPPFRMLVTGSGFAPGALVRWDGIARITSFLSPTQLTTDVTASDLAVSRTFQVGVANPAPGASLSPTSVPFTIYAVPTLTIVDLGILPWFQTRVTFDDPPPTTTLAPLNGLYPRPPSSLPPRLNFPTGQWEWQEERVNNVMVRDIFFSNNPALPANSRSFSFANGPRILSSVEVITPTAGTLTLRDDNGRAVTRQITVGPVQTVATGWFDQPSAAISVEFTAGRDLGITAISYLGLP